jgi:hypothetical protein
VTLGERVERSRVVEVQVLDRQRRPEIPAHPKLDPDAEAALDVDAGRVVGLGQRGDDAAHVVAGRGVARDGHRERHLGRLARLDRDRGPVALHPGADAGLLVGPAAQVELAGGGGVSVGGVDAEVERGLATVGDDQGVLDRAARVHRVAVAGAVGAEGVGGRADGPGDVTLVGEGRHGRRKSRHGGEQGRGGGANEGGLHRGVLGATRWGRRSRERLPREQNQLLSAVIVRVAR